MSRVRTPDGVPINRGLIVTLYFHVDKKIVEISALLKMGSVKNVGVEDTPRISEPLSFFEKTLAGFELERVIRR